MNEILDTTLKGAESVALEQYNKLRKTQFTINGGLALVIVILMLALWHFNSGYEKALAAAEVREKDWKVQVENLNKRLEQSEKERNAIAAEQVRLNEELEASRKKSAQVVSQLTKPGRPVEQVQQDVQDYIRVAPLVDKEHGLFTFTTEQTQQLAAMGEQLRESQNELKITQDLYEKEKQKTASLQSDLNETKGKLAEANGVIDGYKKAAKKSLPKRILDTGWKIGLGVLFGAALGL